MFDLTTSAGWRGPPVGIVRAERELARFAPEVVDLPVEFSVFDLQRKVFLRLRSEVVADILDERATIDFSWNVERRSLSKLASWAARDPRGFAAAVLNWYRARAMEGTDTPDEPKGPVPIALEAGVDGVLEFGSGDVLISCGLDWAHKDYEAISDERSRSGFSYVGVCYDTIPWKFPHFWPDGLGPAVITALAEMAWMSDAVMCISKATAEDYSEFCSQLQVPCPKLEVFRLGDTNSNETTRGTFPKRLEGKRFVLCVGSIEPRKNHRLLYNVWEELARDPTFPDDVTLAIVGAVQWMSADLIREMQLNPTVKDRIVVIDDASDPVLHALLADCLFTVFPSLYEGWGLPVAESLNQGKVCIASERGSIPEISHLTVMLPPRDHSAWRDAIRRYVLEDSERLSLERRIREEFRSTTWHDCAQSFFERVRTCLAS